jgi:hypothetical protein
MQFTNDHWRDKRYIAIQEELNHAGFSCVRADEIKTSGPVVDEVCRLLREADLVVIVSTGDSHSVSYEIGYCHGVGRAGDSTLLLRDNSDIPFNYRHYRHRVYRDLKHLRRLVRDYLKIYEPLSPEQYGFTFSFSFSGHYGYIQNGAFCIFEALRQGQFTGRCECYSVERFTLGNFFCVGVMLRRQNRPAIPDYDWWTKLQESVAQIHTKFKDSITLEPELCEMAMKSAMTASFLPCGIAEFTDGHVSRILGSDVDSFFRSYQDSLKKQQAS